VKCHCPNRNGPTARVIKSAEQRRLQRGVGPQCRKVSLRSMKHRCIEVFPIQNRLTVRAHSQMEIAAMMG